MLVRRPARARRWPAAGRASPSAAKKSVGAYESFPSLSVVLVGQNGSAELKWIASLRVSLYTDPIHLRSHSVRIGGGKAYFPQAGAAGGFHPDSCATPELAACTCRSRSNAASIARHGV